MYKPFLLLSLWGGMILGTLDIGSTAAVISLLFVGAGIFFSGYFGYRDRSWRTSAGGWKDAFENQRSENQTLISQVTSLQAEVSTLRSQPDMSAVLEAIQNHSEAVKERHLQILQTLNGIAQNQTRILDSSKPQGKSDG